MALFSEMATMADKIMFFRFVEKDLAGWKLLEKLGGWRLYLHIFTDHRILILPIQYYQLH
jgi:hypothetical protein